MRSWTGPQIIGVSIALQIGIQSSASVTTTTWLANDDLHGGGLQEMAN